MATQNDSAILNAIINPLFPIGEFIETEEDPEALLTGESISCSFATCWAEWPWIMRIHASNFPSIVH